MKLVNEHAQQNLPDEYSWLGGGQSYVVCAFYTPDYLAHASELRQSLESFGISHFLKRYERSAGWEAATRIKPSFIEYCLAKLQPRHVLYIDADAAVRQPLSFLDEITTDVALSFEFKAREKEQPRLRIVPGTIYVRNTPGGRRFVEAWREAEKNCGPLATDSYMLRVAIGRLQGLTLTVLPGTYAKGGDEGSQPVIQHFRVSRNKSSIKRRRASRKRRQITIIVGLTALVAVAYFLLTI